MLKLRQSKEGVREDPGRKKKSASSMRGMNALWVLFTGRTAYMLPGYQTSPYRTYLAMVSDMCPTDASVAGLESNTLRIDEPEERIFVYICLMRSPAKLELIRSIFCLKKCALEEARPPGV